jgi:hypothetical protein
MEYEERVVHVVWAAHILSYLTSGRSHAELHEFDADSETFEDASPVMRPKTQRFLQARNSLFAESSWTALLSCYQHPKMGWCHGGGGTT